MHSLSAVKDCLHTNFNSLFIHCVRLHYAGRIFQYKTYNFHNTLIVDRLN